MADGAAHARRAGAQLTYKLVVALLVFASITGSWLAWGEVQASRASARIAATPLPEARQAHGRCTIWFVGSSSIAKWRTLRADMAPWDAHNRGVSGASLSQVTQRFRIEVTKTPPIAILFYAGENDLADGELVEDTFDRFAAFIVEKRRLMGRTPVLALSMKPSPTRWGDRPQQAAYNRVLRRIAESEDDIAYIDIVPELLVMGRPGPFYVADGIHLNPAGYRILAAAVRAELPRTLPPETLRACDGAAAAAREPRH